MANHNSSGRDDENRAGWRPQDDRAPRDNGQGQSGYSAGRLKNDHSWGENRNESYAARQQRSQGNTDARWSGHGGADNEDRDYYPERYGAEGGYAGGSGFEGRYGREDLAYGPQPTPSMNRFGESFADRGGFDRGGFDASAQPRGGSQGREPVRGTQRMNPTQVNNQGWTAYGPHTEPTRSYGSDRSMYGQGAQSAPGLHRGKGPKGYQRTDDRILELANEALEADDHVDATHIEVIVQNGDVTLTGVVDDRMQKRAAEDVIAHLSGVKDVQNSLRLAGRQPRADRSVVQATSGTGNGHGEATAHESTPSTTTASDKKARA